MDSQADGERVVQQQYRLAKKEDFNKVYHYGKSAANLQFVIYYLPNPQIERFRLGVSASKKLGNAVIRNRLRRTVKEVVRHHIEQVVPGYDFIVIVRKPAVDMEYRDAEKSLLHALRRASLLKNK